MKLYVRIKPKWINFLHNVEDMSSFEESYNRGTSIVIGDLSMFNKYMLSKLLKLLEENPMIDCYTSQDLCDPVLLSRFTEIVKEPLKVSRSLSSDSYSESDKSYQSVAMYLDLKPSNALLAKGRSKLDIVLLQRYDTKGN